MAVVGDFWWEDSFQEHFSDIFSKLERNLAIMNVYEDGYTQVSIENT